MQYIVRRLHIAGTHTYVFSVWEESSVTGPHGTITTFGDKWYGRVGTKSLTPEQDKALPAMSEERSRVVLANREAQYRLAYNLIRQAFPGLKGAEDMGEIEVQTPHKMPHKIVVVNA